MDVKSKIAEREPEREGNSMEKILDVISGEMQKAFQAAGYDAELGKVTLSNRPD